MSAAAACSALLQRDIRAVLRSRSQLYSSMLFPLMLLAILGTGVSEGLDPTLVRDGDYASFLVPGTIAMTVLFSSTFSSASYYQDRDCGLLRVLLGSPPPPPRRGGGAAGPPGGAAGDLAGEGAGGREHRRRPGAGRTGRRGGGPLHRPGVAVRGGRGRPGGRRRAPARSPPQRLRPGGSGAHPHDAGVPPGDEPGPLPAAVLLRRLLPAGAPAGRAEGAGLRQPHHLRCGHPSPGRLRRGRRRLHRPAGRFRGARIARAGGLPLGDEPPDGLPAVITVRPRLRPAWPLLAPAALTAAAACGGSSGQDALFPDVLTPGEGDNPPP